MKITIFKIDKGIERLRAKQSRRWALEARIEASTYLRFAGARCKEILAGSKTKPKRKIGVSIQLNQARVSFNAAISCYKRAGDPAKKGLSEGEYDLMAQAFRDSLEKSKESLAAAERADQMLKVELN